MGHLWAFCALFADYLRNYLEYLENFKTQFANAERSFTSPKHFPIRGIQEGENALTRFFSWTPTIAPPVGQLWASNLRHHFHHEIIVQIDWLKRQDKIWIL